MLAGPDVLELLLPGAPDAALRRARGVTQFLRLLVDDARRSRAPAVGLDLSHAHGVLDEANREALVRALEDLVRHHLAAVAPVGWFGGADGPRATAAAAWREVEAARGEFPALPDLPRPEESARDVGARVLTALAQFAVPAQHSLWNARWTHATLGPRAGEAAYRALFAGPRRPRGATWLARAAIGGVAECLLERGAVREARAWLGEHALQVSVDPRLRQLFAWTRAALEDEAGARTVLQGLPAFEGPLPAPLCALRTARPEWAFALSGRARPPAGGRVPDDADGSRPADPEPGRTHERGDLGASALLVLSFAPGRGADLVHADAAPALLSKCPAWIAERDGAWSACGEREHQLCARAAAVVQRAGRDQVLHGVLGGTATRAVALVPVLDDDGDAAGWIHAEFEHQLVPAPDRLRACAEHWRRAVLVARAGVADAGGSRTPGTQGVLAPVFEALVADLGIKTVQRRWTGYVIVSGEPVPIASGGEGQGFADMAPGRGRGLARALATGSWLAFDDPDPRVAVHAAAGSGFVLPLAFEGVALGLLAVESSRRRDFVGAPFEAWTARADAAATALAAARFAAWHAERFGPAPWFESARPGFARFASRLVRAARTRSAVLVEGPAGAGKHVVACWIHAESALRDGPLVVAGPALTRGDWRVLTARAAGGTLVLEDVEALAPDVQESLVRHLEPAVEADERAPRIVALTRGLESRATLRRDLALRLVRTRLVVPGLAQRREEIPGLCAALLDRRAAEEGAAPVRLDDGALALVWRAPWPGNVRELENLASELVFSHAGRSLSAAEVAEAAQECGVELPRRLPHRRPDPRDVRAALWTTRTLGGRTNKTRAALYLGWDPDTLVLRMREAGIADEAHAPQVWCAAQEAPESIGITTELAGELATDAAARAGASAVPSAVPGAVASTGPSTVPSAVPSAVASTSSRQGTPPDPQP